jgi:hypothetical protein
MFGDDDVEQIAEADRRVVDPPIQVETATWSRAGQFDGGRKNRSNGGVAYAVQRPAAASRNLQGRREARAVLRSIGVRANVRSVSEESSTNGRTNW